MTRIEQFCQNGPLLQLKASPIWVGVLEEAKQGDLTHQDRGFEFSSSPAWHRGIFLPLSRWRSGRTIIFVVLESRSKHWFQELHAAFGKQSTVGSLS